MCYFLDRAKQKEMEAGVDGFMVYDVRLVQPSQQVVHQMVMKITSFRLNSIKTRVFQLIQRYIVDASIALY